MKRRILNHTRKESLFILAYSFTYSPFTFFNSKLRKWKDVRASVFTPLRWMHAPSPIYLFILLILWLLSLGNRSLIELLPLFGYSLPSFPPVKHILVPLLVLKVKTIDSFFSCSYSLIRSLLFYHSVIKEAQPQPFSFCSCELFFLSQ